MRRSGTRTHRSSFGADVGVDERVADASAQVVDDALAQPVAGQRLGLVAGVGCGVGGVTQWGHRPPRSARDSGVDWRLGAPGRPRCARVRGWPAGGELVTTPLGGHVLVLDALLQQHDAFEQGFGPRRAAGDVHVDRDDLVDALGDRVAVPVRAAAVGTRAHRDGVLRLGHLLPQAADRPAPSCR